MDILFHDVNVKFTITRFLHFPTYFNRYFFHFFSISQLFYLLNLFLKIRIYFQRIQMTQYYVNVHLKQEKSGEIINMIDSNNSESCQCFWLDIKETHGTMLHYNHNEITLLCELAKQVLYLSIHLTIAIQKLSENAIENCKKNHSNEFNICKLS